MGCCSSKTQVEDFKADEMSSSSSYEVGVKRERGCTDVPFCIILLMFIAGMGYVGYRGIRTGDPYRLIYGYDSWGNVCGRQNVRIENVTQSGKDMTNRTKTFFHDETYFFKKFLPSLSPGPDTFTLPPALSSWTQGSPLVSNDPIVCVNQCPTSILVNSSQIAPFCTYESPSICPDSPVNIHRVLLNRCVPSSFFALADAVTSSIKSVVSGGVAQKVFADIQSTWREQLYLAAISFGMALFIVILLKFLAAVILWTLTVLMVLLGFAAAGFCWYQWYVKNEHKATQAVTTAEMEGDVKTWMVYACIASSVAVIVLLVAIVMGKRIRLVVELFKEAGSALGRIPLLLIQPVWTLIVLLAVVAGLAFIALFLETAGNPTIDQSTGHVTYEPDTLMQYLRWYHFCGFLWLSAFVVACQDLVIAGALAEWYFASDKTKLGYPICRSIRNLIRYHLGTVAFGSLIIAIVRFVRFVLAMVHKRLKGKTGKIAEFLLKILMCCLWCFEKFIQYLNRNAYIMTASHGYSFCTGAKKAFMLLIANVLRVAALNSVGNFILFLAKMGCAAIAVVVGSELLASRTDLNYSWAPLTVGAAIAFTITHCFMMIYEITLDTIFLCFCEDCEENDGLTKPYHMSKNLMKCIDNINKDAENREARRKRKGEENV